MAKSKPQPIEPDTDATEGWVYQTFEHDQTKDRYVAVVPVTGPTHYHTDCWCRPITEWPAHDIAHGSNSTPLIIHYAAN